MILRTFLPYSCPACQTALRQEVRFSRRHLSTRLACPICAFASDWRRRTWVRAFWQGLLYLGGCALAVFFLWALTCVALILGD